MSEVMENKPALLENSTGLTVFEIDRTDEIIAAIKDEAFSLVADPNTRKGREELKSQAHKVSKCKTHLVSLAKSSIEEHSAIVKSVTGERVRLERELDAIRDEVKAPALEWERKEEERIKTHRARIDWVRQLSINAELMTSEAIGSAIQNASEFDATELEEFQPEAEKAKDLALDTLNTAFAAVKKREAEAAELKRLQEAEAIRKEAEAKALAEKQAAQAQAARKLKAEAEAKQRKIDEENRIEQAKAQAAKEERERLERIQREKEAKAKREAEEAEAKRLAAENADLKRKADESHRNKVRQDVALAIRKVINECSLESDLEANLTTAIETGSIPGVTLSF